MKDQTTPIKSSLARLDEKSPDGGLSGATFILINGSDVLKHCKVGTRRNNKTHPSRIQLSRDQKRVLWGFDSASRENKSIRIKDVTEFIVGHAEDASSLSWTEEQKAQSFKLSAGTRTLAVIFERKKEFDLWVAGLTKLLTAEGKAGVIETL